MLKMKAAFIQRYGKNEKLTFAELPYPHVGSQDVLIQIKAASLNPIDFKIRDGKLKFIRSYQFPLILGHDFSGVVIEVGSEVTRFKKGDRVFSRPRNGRTGSLAEFISVDEKELSVMPEDLSYINAASIPLVGLTSWQALFDIAHMKKGSRVLIQAGSGGVGSFAIQLAKRFGAYVLTTTSTKNVDFVKSLGADVVIDYKKQNFEDEARDLDIIFDTLGGEALYKSFQLLRPGGWVVSIAGDPDHNLAKDMGLNPFKTFILKLLGRKAHALAKKAQGHYRFIFMKPNSDQLSQIAQLVSNGKIMPIVDRVFSFHQAQEALDYLESGHARGKVVIKIHED